MDNNMRMWKIRILSGVVFILFNLFAQGQVDSISHRFVHGLSIEARPEYIFPTNVFLRGDNPERRLIRSSFSAHLKYSLRYNPGTPANRIYGNVYQGIGLGRYSFGEPEQLGNPMAFYLFQGAHITRFSHWLSLDYEWNFGLSSGWKPYHEQYNSSNRMMGSKINAYINANFYLRWMPSPCFNLTAGVTLAHFSNGNTNYPNAGLNTIGLKVGLDYYFHRKDDLLSKVNAAQTPIPAFCRHISYDFVVFGSWRRKGIDVLDGQIPSPEAYPVFGINFVPMYNLSYKFRLGVSLDGVYDGSANVYVKDSYSGGNLDKADIIRPELRNQFSIGFSGRMEYVMPFFTMGIGMGTNVVGQGDLRAFYQLLTLKVALTRDSFFHVGYNLQNFSEPNFLMLGIGFRFNNKYLYL